MSEPFAAEQGHKSFGLAVIIAGLITSAITLGIVYALSQAGLMVMGFYLNYVIPIGALLAGFAAGSGYALATWKKGAKVTGAACGLIVLLSFISYFAAQYIEFSHLAPTYEDGTALGFWEFFDFSTRSFAWKKSGKMGDPLGVWGYALRALEVSGFVFGGLVGAMILKASPYCEPCGLYMRKRKLAVLPASITPRKFRKGDPQEQPHEAQQNQALTAAHAVIESLAEAGKGGDEGLFNRILDSTAKITERQAVKLPLVYRLKLIYCTGCARGNLVVESVERHKKEVKVQEAARYDVDAALIAKLANLQPRLATMTSGEPRGLG